MLFTAENCQKIIDGCKMQTRRLVKDGEYITEVMSVMDGQTLRERWRAFHAYAIQPGRGKKAVGQIKLLSIRKERLQDITAGDCQREGLAPDESVDEFLRDADLLKRFQTLWDSIYSKHSGKRWSDNPQVWVLEFMLKEYPNGNAN